MRSARTAKRMKEREKEGDKCIGPMPSDYPPEAAGQRRGKFQQGGNLMKLVRKLALAAGLIAVGAIAAHAEGVDEIENRLRRVMR